MRKNGGSFLPGMPTIFVFVILLGSLALPAQCKYISIFHKLYDINIYAKISFISSKNNTAGHRLLLDVGSSVTIAANSTSLDEKKINLIFCTIVRCDFFDPSVGIAIAART